MGPEGVEPKLTEGDETSALARELHLVPEALGSKLLSPGMLAAGVTEEGRHRF